VQLPLSEDERTAGKLEVRFFPAVRQDERMTAMDWLIETTIAKIREFLMDKKAMILEIRRWVDLILERNAHFRIKKLMIV